MAHSRVVALRGGTLAPHWDGHSGFSVGVLGIPSLDVALASKYGSIGAQRQQMLLKSQGDGAVLSSFDELE